MTTERKGLVTFGGKPMTLAGTPVNVGDKAPDFTAVAKDLSLRSLADYKGRILLFSTVPSLDTGICNLQTRRFNAEAAALDERVKILTFSCDLPFAQARWCGAAGANAVETLSDYKDLSFGLSYGLVMKELRLLARAVLVVDAAGTVAYEQIVPEIKSEVDYEAALNAVKACLH